MELLQLVLFCARRVVLCEWIRGKEPGNICSSHEMTSSNPTLRITLFFDNVLVMEFSFVIQKFDSYFRKELFNLPSATAGP